MLTTEEIKIHGWSQDGKNGRISGISTTSKEEKTREIGVGGNRINIRGRRTGIGVEKMIRAKIEAGSMTIESDNTIPLTLMIDLFKLNINYLFINKT